MNNKPNSCQGCPLYETGEGFVRTTGTGVNGVFLLGEAPGESEAIKSEPFVGDAGYLLNQVLHRGALRRNDFLIGNAGINCRPPNNWLEGAPWEGPAIDHCDQYLVEALAQRPDIKVLVPMGNVGLRKLLGVQGIKNHHGSVAWNARFGRWVVPTLHPSYVLRTGWKEFPTILFDIKRALKVAHDNGFPRAETRYILNPSPTEFAAWASSVPPLSMLGFDIETDISYIIDEEDIADVDSIGSEITRISFSYESGTAITVPFTSEFLPSIRRLLASPNIKCSWNGWAFDLPKLRHAGFEVNGMQIDSMIAWHVYRPDLPKGLGYVAPFWTDLPPWKNLSQSEPEYYSCVDSDALIRITQGLQKAMLSDGTWDYFLSHWVALQPRLEAMTAVGIGVDEGMRQSLKADYESLRDNVTERLQPLVPDLIKPTKKGKDGGYKGKPLDVRAYIKEHSLPKDREQEAWTTLGYFPLEHRGKNKLGEDEVQIRWDKYEPFNHNSPQQIIRYITNEYGQGAVPRNKRTGAPTTELEELKRLAKRRNDKVLGLIIEASEADSNISSFVKPWAPGPDGRIHSTFTNAPATGRLASERPNCQNFPRRSDEGKKMRQMIVPGDGYEWLVEADYKSIEAILVGVYANDPHYTRIAYFGIHDFMAGNKLGLDISPDLSDADLKIALKEAKKLGNSTRVPGTTLAVRDACKVSVHGGNYLEGPLLLHKTYPELFPKVRDAEEYQDFYFGLFPKIPVWQQEVVNTTYETCYVQTKWNTRRWFWHVKEWYYSKPKSKWELRPVVGSDGDAKKAVATNPQSSAGLIMRGALCSAVAQELINRQLLMLSIHDSLVARAANTRERDQVIELLKTTMEYPIPELGGIVIPVETKVGRNWATMEEI